MEFFDFTGTNDEEKAQVLDIITTNESSGVEFFLNYNNNNNNNSTRILNNHNHGHNRQSHHHNEHSKSTSYLHANGDLLTPLPNTNGNYHHNHNNHHHNHNNSLSSSAHHNRHQNDSSNETIDITQSINNTTNNNYPHVSAAINNTEWETPTSTSTTSTSSSNESAPQNVTSNVLVSNMAAIQPATATGGPPPPHQYLIGAHPYFTGPHPGPPHPNHHYAIHAHPAAAFSPHQVNHHSMSNHISKQILSMPSVPAMQNIASSPTMMNNKNSSKNTTVNSSNCDIRNSIYMSPAQYSEAPLIDNQRLKNSALPVSGDGGNIMSDSLVSNGSAIAVPPHHLGPYSHYAFHQTHALPFPPHHGHHFTQPIYYVSPEGFLQYPTFSPSTAPPAHISPISAAHHAANVITSSSSVEMGATNTSAAVAMSINHGLASSVPASAPSTTATLSNLSSMSASSSSIPAAYHSSLQSSASDTPVFESNNHDSNNYIHQNDSLNTDSMSDSNKDVDSSSKVPSHPLPTESSQEHSNDSSSNTHVDSNEASATTNKQVSKVEEMFKLCLKIPDQQEKDETEKADADEEEEITADSAQMNTETLVTNSENMSNTNKSSSDASLKPTTWASKLFPATNSIPSANSASSSSNMNEANKSTNEEWKNTIPSGDNTAANSEVNKSNLQNGEYPELNSKTIVNSNIYANHSSNRRGGRFSSNHDDDYKKLTIISDMKEDQIALKLARRLRDTIHLKHSLPTIMPCGLINRGNWCYVNATLQALLACPPFYNLMREISETGGLFRKFTSTPIIDNFARYFSKFLPSDYKRQMKSGANPYLEELLNRDPFEPVFIYDTLKHIGMIKNDAQRGHQEDAEEFLSSVLNGLHDEMIKLFKTLDNFNDKKKNINTKTNGFGSGGSDDEALNSFDEDGLCHTVDDNGQDSNDIWHEVGTSKHKSLPTRSAKVISTPITEIFGGTTLDIRTVNKDKDSCGNRQPFFTLQLDIKPPSIKSLEEAIRSQTKAETIHGYTCSKTKQMVDASSQMFLENLPLILILHLKLFDYDIETGASKKLLKTVNFQENFEIPRECVTGKIDVRSRKYKLLAVVYHTGSEVVNGHYVTDVYHLGLNQWLRCDDATIKMISINKVLNNNNDREGSLVPYLLFYRRFDTLHNNSSSSSMSSSSSSNNNGNNVQSSGTNVNNGKQQRTSSSTTFIMTNNMDYGSHNSHYNNSHDDQHDNSNNHNLLTNNKFSSISRQS